MACTVLWKMYIEFHSLWCDPLFQNLQSGMTLSKWINDVQLDLSAVDCMGQYSSGRAAKIQDISSLHSNPTKAVVEFKFSHWWRLLFFKWQALIMMITMSFKIKFAVLLVPWCVLSHRPVWGGCSTDRRELPLECTVTPYLISSHGVRWLRRSNTGLIWASQIWVIHMSSHSWGDDARPCWKKYLEEIAKVVR